jgi:hypothetical protein
MRQLAGRRRLSQAGPCARWLVIEKRDPFALTYSLAIDAARRTPRGDVCLVQCSLRPECKRVLGRAARARPGREPAATPSHPRHRRSRRERNSKETFVQAVDRVRRPLGIETVRPRAPGAGRQMPGASSRRSGNGRVTAGTLAAARDLWLPNRGCCDGHAQHGSAGARFLSSSGVGSKGTGGSVEPVRRPRFGGL